MTCIAGAIKGSEVWIGGDAASSSGDAVRMGTQPKVFPVGDFLVGSSGSVRLQQIIRYLFEPPKLNGSDLTAYMVKEFSPALRALIKTEEGETNSENPGIERIDGCFLIAVKGRLFQIDSAYGVFESKAPYAAIGCADQEALAAMFTVNALLAGDASGEDIVRRGLLAAAEFDSNIRPPFTILKLNV